MKKSEHVLASLLLSMHIDPVYLQRMHGRKMLHLVFLLLHDKHACTSRLRAAHRRNFDRCRVSAFPSIGIGNLFCSPKKVVMNTIL